MQLANKRNFLSKRFRQDTIYFLKTNTKTVKAARPKLRPRHLHQDHDS